MLKLIFLNKVSNAILKTITIIAVVVSMIGAFVITPIGVTNRVDAATTPISINMIYYGWFNSTVTNNIINTYPKYLVANSPAGPWGGNANISLFMSAGIKYFEYIDGGYEGTIHQDIPNDITHNLTYIEAAARAGAYGIFLDEVSDGIFLTPDYDYLEQIADKAHSLGLKVVFNTGMSTWADQLMNYCDFINSSETWSNTPLTTSQSKWASRTWLLTYGVYDATTAANLTIGAWSKGISAQYSCSAFSGLPYWFESYISQITPYVPTTYVPPPTTGQTSVTFNSTPSGAEVWLDYSYKGITPLTLTIPAGSHYIGFNLYGYHSNVPIVGTFVMGNTSLTVNGNLLTGQISSSSGVVTSTQTAVTFGSNLSGVEVWLDYVYKGVTPLTLTVSAGNHYMGFYKYGYHYNQAVTVDFSLSGQTNLNIYGDMLSGYTSIMDGTIIQLIRGLLMLTRSLWLVTVLQVHGEAMLISVYSCPRGSSIMNT
jgi:hypothetical protein